MWRDEAGEDEARARDAVVVVIVVACGGRDEVGEETGAMRRRLRMWRDEVGDEEAGTRCRRRRSHAARIFVARACGGTTRGRGAAAVGGVDE